MDKRYKPLSVSEQVLLRKNTIEEILAHPEWTLAQTIRHMKNQLRLTSSELAKLSGLSHRAVQDIEQERSEGTVKTLNRLLGVLNLRLGVIARTDKNT